MIPLTGALRGRTVLVTGGSRGIGKAIAKKAASDGANVAICARTKASLDEAVTELVMDMRDEASIASAIEQIVARFGGLDVVVNNAGALYVQKTEDIQLEHYDAMHDTIARGTFLTCKLALPHLKKSLDARIVNISPPMAGTSSWLAKNLAYSLAKYQASMTTIGLSKEWAQFNIAVNSLWPKAVVWTSGVSHVGGDESVRRHCRSATILGDAFYALVTERERRSGRLLFDEDVLSQVTLANFDEYAEEPGNKLIYCTFLSEDDKKAFDGIELKSLLKDFVD